MRWHKALQPGNTSLANEVARWLRNEFGWSVAILDGCIQEVRRYDGTGDRVYTRDESITSPIDLAQRLVESLNIGWRTIEKINDKFGSSPSIGDFTRIPFPSDIVKQPPAAASSLSVKEGSSLPSLPDGVHIIPMGEFVNQLGGHHV